MKSQNKKTSPEPVVVSQKFEEQNFGGVPVSAFPTSNPEHQTPDYPWLIGCIVVTAIAVFWRFWQLELKPLHHDEGVNGHFLITLFRENVYKYDPSNYHGPDLYYISL